MTPPNEPPSNPYDPNWPKPEQPEQPDDETQPYGQPWGQAPSAQQPPESGQPAPYAPYGQPQPSEQAPYGQPTYPPQAPVPYGAPTYGGPVSPPHPSATTAMVLGICALGGMFVCGLPIVLAPFAWMIGGRAVKDIDANPGRYSGREQAQAGRIMGMIGSGLLVLATLALVAVVTLAVVADDTYDSSFPADPDSSTDSSF